MVSFLYLSREEDPTYVERREYAGLALRDKHPPVDGARLAVKESQIRGRALKLGFALEEKALAPGEDAVAAVAAAPDRGRCCSTCRSTRPRRWSTRWATATT